MDKIQSHYFLQALYTAFLGVQQEKRRATEHVDFDPATANMAKSHPLWTRIVRLMHSTTDTADLAAPLEGLSSTVSEAITELATSMKNIWEGNIEYKLLDYLLRFLLRIFLAPEREKRNKERIQRAIKKREEKKGKVKDKKPSKSLQQLHARELCDELICLFHSQPAKEHRIIAILTQLARHNGWDAIAVEGQSGVTSHAHHMTMPTLPWQALHLSRSCSRPSRMSRTMRTRRKTLPLPRPPHAQSQVF